MTFQVLRDQGRRMVDIQAEAKVIVFRVQVKGLVKEDRLLRAVTQAVIKVQQEYSRVVDKELLPVFLAGLKDLQVFLVELKDLLLDSQVGDKDLLQDFQVEDKGLLQDSLVQDKDLLQDSQVEEDKELLQDFQVLDNHQVVKVRHQGFRVVDKVPQVDSLVRAKVHQEDSLVEVKVLLVDSQVEQVQAVVQAVKPLLAEMTMMALLMVIILPYQVNQERITQFYLKFRKLASVVMLNSSLDTTLMLKLNVKYSTFVQIIKLTISCVQMARFSINNTLCAYGGISLIVVQHLVYSI